MPTRLKNLVDARRAKTGESWSTALRAVRAQESRPSLVIAPSQMTQPRFRHVYLRSAARYPLQFFSVNQAVSYFIVKFTNGWSATEKYVEPVFDSANWAQEDEASEADLQSLARRALANVRRSGYVLVVHAPGRLALVWSDHDVPREARLMKERFGPSLRAVPAQSIVEGREPTWWPPIPGGGVPSPLICVTRQDNVDGGTHLIARCTACGAGSYADFVPNLQNVDWQMLVAYVEATFDRLSLDITSIPLAHQAELVAISKDLISAWRRELRNNDGCTHV
jgi:hypothetical protein